MPHPHCAEVITTASLDQKLPRTQFLVLACPLTDATRGLMDRERLRLLPRGAGVVNIGRGALIDQDDDDVDEHGWLPDMIIVG